MPSWEDRKRSVPPDDVRNNVADQARDVHRQNHMAPFEGVPAGVRSTKRIIHSAVFNRLAHFDVFQVGSSEPKMLLVYFSGSGVDRDEYERRSQSIIPVFRPTLEYVDRRAMNLTMVFVTSPYDVPLNRFARDPSLAERWNKHVLDELLQPWCSLPCFLCSFSGGAALALNGIDQHSRCFGGAVFGPDAIPPNFACPPHWATRLRVYAAPGDSVCDHVANRRLIALLAARGQVERHSVPAGRHALVTYCGPDCLGDVICFADSIAPQEA